MGRETVNFAKNEDGTEVEGVILAAGYSKRAGVYKMELDFDGNKMIELSIHALYDICSRLVIVGGYKVDRIEKIAKSYPKVEVIYNENFDDGMFSSVKKGLAATRAEKVFFTPGDYPLINRRICELLLKSDGDIVIPMWKGKKGHPILLKRHRIKEILEEAEDSTLKCYIRRKVATFVEVNDPGILYDVDTIDDYRNLLTHYRCLFPNKNKGDQRLQDNEIKK